MLIAAVLLPLGLGVDANANDRDDARALVGYWKCANFFGGDDYRFNADGTYIRYDVIKLNGTWAVKDGKIAFSENFPNKQEYTQEFRLSPDEKTLRMQRSGRDDWDSFKRK